LTPVGAIKARQGRSFHFPFPSPVLRLRTSGAFDAALLVAASVPRDHTEQGFESMNALHTPVVSSRKNGTNGQQRC